VVLTSSEHLSLQICDTDQGLRRAVAFVATLNLAYFAVEFSVALLIASVSLLADSVDFLEDATVNFLVLFALRWSVHQRARVGMLLAGVLLVPALAFLWALWNKLMHPVPPEALTLSATATGALLVNVVCAFILVRFRDSRGSLTKAAFLSARNDAVANAAIIAAGLATALRPSIWPDVLVGIGIALMNADAAKEVWQAARAERSEVREQS
jgi:Co/Zn/Cd efflux system component